MKKGILIIITTLVVIIAIVLATVIVLSFSFFKKNKDTLIKIQRDKLMAIINIPNAVSPSNPTYNSISYTWEMETPQKEVSTINVLQTTGIDRYDNSILVVLEKTAQGDSSIFDKVLPAVIVDEEVLRAAFSSEQTTTIKTGKTGFKKVSIERDSSGKVVKIVWEFDKYKFGDRPDDIFQKLNKFPQPFIKSLYLTQNIIISAFSGQ